LNQTSKPVLNLTKSIQNTLIKTGLEEGRAHGFAIRLASLLPGVTAEELAGSRYATSGYSRPGTFSTSASYGRQIKDAVVSSIDGMVDISGPDGPGTVESFISDRVNSVAKSSASAFNSSILSTTEGLPVHALISADIAKDIAKQEELGVVDFGKLNKFFLSPRLAPALTEMGITQAKRSVSITKSLVDDIPKDINWATSVAGTIASSGTAAIQPAADEIAQRGAPVARIAQRVGVMGKKTLEMLINAGETAARVMR